MDIIFFDIHGYLGRAILRILACPLSFMSPFTKIRNVTVKVILTAEIAECAEKVQNDRMRKIRRILLEDVFFYEQNSQIGLTAATHYYRIIYPEKNYISIVRI